MISYKPFVDAIDLKTKGRLDTPLHLCAYYLNPFYYYAHMLEDNDTVKEGFMECLFSFYSDMSIQYIIIRQELTLYKFSQGPFGWPMAVKQRERMDEHYDPGTYLSCQKALSYYFTLICVNIFIFEMV